MASPSFLLPFAHWGTLTSFVPPSSSITVAKFLPKWLLLGLSCGELLQLSTGPDIDGITLSPHARLSGHKAAVIALQTLLARTEAGEELLLLSLDGEGRMCKWSLSDGRCLQSVSGTISSRPRGIRVIKHGAAPLYAVPDPVVVVYGCSTEIVVLNAETLETILLWTGNVNWPLPAVADGGQEILTLMPFGEVQGWILEKRAPEGRAVATVGVEKDHHRQFTIQSRNTCGVIMGFERCAKNDYVVVQQRGVRVYAAENQSLVLRKTIDMAPGDTDIAGYEVFEERGIVFVWNVDGEIRVIERGETGLWGLAGIIARPESIGHGQGAMVMAFTKRRNNWVVTVFSHAKSDSVKRLGAVTLHGESAVGIFSIKNDGHDIQWNENNEGVDVLISDIMAALLLFTTPPSEGEAPLSSCSAVFSNMMAFAHGCILRLHTLSSFLLSYHEPIMKIYIPTAATVVLLKRIRIGEYIGIGRDAGVQGGKEYLVVGSSAGELFIVEAPSFHSSQRLPLSATHIVSANLLLSNLGKRLRSTLFVTSVDGTASIVDVERARIMVTFPSHDYLQCVSFATKMGQNVILLTYEDGTRREWDLGEEEGGVLKSPPSSRGSDRIRGGEVVPRGPYAADLADEGWREVRVGMFEVEEEDREDEGEAQSGDGTVKACERFCEEGLPTAVVSVRTVLETLKAAVNMARERTRASERVVVGNHPTLITAKSVLTALVPGGVGELLGLEEEGDDDYEWRVSVDRYFFRRKKPAVLGQIGAGRHVSLLSQQAINCTEGGVWGVGSTVTSIVLLAALAIVGGLLEASGKEEMFDAVIERALKNQAKIGATPTLGVWAKYWMDVNPLIRKTARKCMHIYMDRSSDECRNQIVEYWSRFLPVSVPPELFSSKEVVRSLIVLGKLTAGWTDKVDASVRKNVALSVELLLGDSNPFFQDTAIELVGYGWSAFQSLFDPFEVIHILIRISASHPDAFPESRRKTLHKCILEIAERNSPLLGSGLSNNIAHGTSSPPVSAMAAPTTSSAVGICVAAMRIVTMVVHEDAILFQDVLNLIVTAVVKILDPSSPLREKVLPTVTELVNEMVEAYPTITFHRPTQRLALSVSPGIILICDLKSATEMNVLQGHHNLANFLSFSLDGRYLASVDLEEDVLFVWRFVTGILSFIGGSEGPTVLQPRRREIFKNTRKVGVVDVEWTGERSVKVMAGGETTEVVNVDGGKGEGGWGIL